MNIENLTKEQAIDIAVKHWGYKLIDGFSAEANFSKKTRYWYVKIIYERNYWHINVECQYSLKDNKIYKLKKSLISEAWEQVGTY